MIKSPVTPDARKEAEAADRPACWNSIGAYYLRPSADRSGISIRWGGQHKEHRRCHLAAACRERKYREPSFSSRALQIHRRNWQSACAKMSFHIRYVHVDAGFVPSIGTLKVSNLLLLSHLIIGFFRTKAAVAACLGIYGEGLASNTYHPLSVRYSKPVPNYRSLLRSSFRYQPSRRFRYEGAKDGIDHSQ